MPAVGGVSARPRDELDPEEYCVDRDSTEYFRKRIYLDENSTLSSYEEQLNDYNEIMYYRVSIIKQFCYMQTYFQVTLKFCNVR